LAQPGKFAVAIIDLQLPVLDDRSLAARIRELPDRANLPLIALSTMGRRDTPAGLFSAFLTKPVKPAPLSDALIEIFSTSRDRPATTPPIPVVLPVAASSLRILLAEDNPVSQKISLHQLTSLGCRADVAANGVEVLEALRRQPYDVVLIDLIMPIMDGLEAARLIRRELPATAQPWLVALTARTMPGDREECYAAGMDDYLGKPLKPHELAGALERARLNLRR
jgi:CheY-like chemotaxis protein